MRIKYRYLLDLKLILWELLTFCLIQTNFLALWRFPFIMLTQKVCLSFLEFSDFLMFTSWEVSVSSVQRWGLYFRLKNGSITLKPCRVPWAHCACRSCKSWSCELNSTSWPTGVTMSAASKEHSYTSLFCLPCSRESANIQCVFVWLWVVGQCKQQNSALWLKIRILVWMESSKE